MKRLQPSVAVFALLLLGIGIWGFAQSAFVAVWAPGIQPDSFRAPMMAVCSLISIIAGGGLLIPPIARPAARLLLAFLCLWLIWCKGMMVLDRGAEFASWESLGETLVVTSAAWAIAAPGEGEWTDPRHNRRWGAGPRLLFGFALILFGLSHLAYVTATAALVPSGLPARVLWVYFTAATYVAAGSALVADRFSRPAAALAAMQMALFTALVWLPKILAGGSDTETLNETALSLTLAASGWVVASAIGTTRPAATSEPPLLASAVKAADRETWSG